jgi:hypothetical protein
MNVDERNDYESVIDIDDTINNDNPLHNRFNNKKNKYTNVDFLLKKINNAEENYFKLLDDVYNLWINVVKNYMDNEPDNGFLQRLKNMSLDGCYREFFNFVISKSDVARNIQADYINSRKISDKHIENITTSFYYNMQKYNAIEELADIHINLIKEKYEDDWNIEYKKVEPLYEKLVETV